MEASYQKYKGKINFVWVYGSEAHPEEYPFQKGYESKDLGWKHPYGITSTMAQRAQRARWMKSDPHPDFEIPMMIDYINDAPNANNAIRKAYLGGGFYSGYVIDCDGTVLYARSWAWFAPGKDWWGLPLDPVANLHKLLDDYLKSPPACYTKGSPADSGPAVPDSGAAGPDRKLAADSGSASEAAASAELGQPKPDSAAAGSPGGAGAGDCSMGQPAGAPWLLLVVGLGLLVRRLARAGRGRA